MDRLRRLDVLVIGLLVILALYETLSSHIHTLEGLLDSILSTIGVKQSCPLSSTLLGLYIDELESFILENTDLEV